MNAKLGMIPNMMKTMAQSAPVLEGYLKLSGALGSGALPAQLREQIALAVAQANGCEYCLSAHSEFGRRAGLNDEDLAASRRAASGDPKTAMALRFVQEVVVHKGHVEDATLTAVRQAGFSDGEIAELVAHVALNIFTNYLNIVAATEVDFPKVEVTLAA